MYKYIYICIYIYIYIYTYIQPITYYPHKCIMINPPPCYRRETVPLPLFGVQLEFCPFRRSNPPPTETHRS